MAVLDSNFVITVDREDGGDAKIILWEAKGGSWINRAEAKHGGWDDALPWSTGDYDGDARADRFKFPAWIINEQFPDRSGLQMHVKLGSSPKKFPISYGSFGCIVAEGSFLKKVKKIVGNGDLDFQVRGFDPNLGLTLTSDKTEVDRGDSVNLRVNLTGDSTGVSKDLWVLVKQVNKKGVKNANKKDYSIDRSDGDFRKLKGEANANDKSLKIKSAMKFVKIESGQTSADIKIDIKALGQNAKQGKSEYAQFKIVDYYYDSPNGKNAHRYYSDHAKGKKILIKQGGDNKELIKINGIDDLGDLSISEAGGIEGFKQTYSAKKGVTYNWTFDAYGIPDSIKIYDNTGTYVQQTNVSGVWSGSFKLNANSNRSVTIEVAGSSQGTAWTFTVEGQKSANSVSEERSNFADGPGAELSNAWLSADADQVKETWAQNVFVFERGQESHKVHFVDHRDKIDLRDFGFRGKSEALSYFRELGSAKNDKIAFQFGDTEIIIKGVDLPEVSGSDLLI